MAAKKYKSKIAAAVHEAMQDAHDAGVIDKRTMREFDESCLIRAQLLSARDIQRLRKREGVSQSVFARHLNVVDGRKIHPVYLYEVKKPAESKGEWDVFKLLSTIPAEEAFGPLAAGGCPLVKG